MQKTENSVIIETPKKSENSDSRYELLEQIGSGTYGTVFKATDKKTGALVAIKQITISESEAERREGLGVTTLREVAILKRLKHPNVVELLDVEYDGQLDLKLVFEFCENGDLHKYLWKKKGQLSKVEAKKMIKQILEGTAYCHAHRVFHRDLKPHNLLIDSNGDIKIADFGLARAFSAPRAVFTHEVVTLWYRAPEILLGMKDYSLAVDIWSIGCIFSEMLMQGRVLIPGTSEVEQLFKTFHLLGTPSPSNWPRAVTLPDFKVVFPKWPARQPFQDLLEPFYTAQKQQVDMRLVKLLTGMMSLDPEQRITCREALESPYFNSLL